jgi:CheY-like chemotaxis protein/c-di-GMP-binding flagellar brake protein YcgR
MHNPSVRFRSTIRGWHSGVRIILDRPEFGSVDPLHEGCLCTVRFLDGGTACAFKTSLTNWLTLSGTKWCYVNWPETFEAISFRKHPRVALNAPCTVRFNGTVAGGTLRDISAGGCGVVTEASMETGREVSLDFNLPSGIMIQNLRSVVRNVRLIQARSCAGCEFVAGQLPVQSEIILFINQTLEHRPAACASSRRLLIIDSEPASNRALCRALSENGFEVYSAPTAIDGLARLQILGPAAVAINLQQDDLAGDKIARLIRTNSAYIHLPVFLFGQAAPDSAERASQAGATGFFPQSALTAGLVEAMRRAVCEAMLHPASEPRPAGGR